RAGVDGDKRAHPARVRGRVEIGDLAFGVELPIVENDKPVAVYLRRLGLIDDHDTTKPAAVLLADKWQNQRMVPEEPAVWRRKTIIERTAGRHRLLRQAAGAIH